MVLELRGDLGSSCAHVYCSACTAGDSRIHSNPRPLTALLKPALLPRHTANMGMQPLHNGRGSQKRPVRALSREMQGLSRLQHRWIVPAQPIRLAFPNPSPCNLVLGPSPPSSSSPTVQAPHTTCIPAPGSPPCSATRRRFSRILEPGPRRELCQPLCRELHRRLHMIARCSG